MSRCRIVGTLRRWWILALPAVFGIFLLVGAATTSNVGDNLDAGGFARVGGTVIQLAAVAVAVVAPLPPSGERRMA